MKKVNALILAELLFLSAAACTETPKPDDRPPEMPIAVSAGAESKPSAMPQAADQPASSENTAEQSEESILQASELVGPWHLDGDRNDLAAFSASLNRFPGYAEWGASMEIKSSGQISWYIGAEGWHGTYSVEDGTIHAQVTSDSGSDTQLWDLHIAAQTGTIILEMDHTDGTLYWVYGDQEDPCASNTDT